ncbi:hypothetical protein C5469_04625 [Photorhabdus cinerea]|uniref:Uncharacterized protein n=1 Tax=Photorhabdus cinerea TaxID=471575 RepID=A0A7X5QBS5_9GAMM|nr:hypothetical protein [Photorhabdus cinerea]
MIKPVYFQSGKGVLSQFYRFLYLVFVGWAEGLISQCKEIPNYQFVIMSNCQYIDENYDFDVVFLLNEKY